MHKINTNRHKGGNQWDYNTPLTSMDRSSRQKISKKTDVLNDTIDQLDLIDIYKTLHPRKPENTYFFKRTWNIL